MNRKRIVCPATNGRICFSWGGSGTRAGKPQWLVSGFNEWVRKSISLFIMWVWPLTRRKHRTSCYSWSQRSQSLLRRGRKLCVAERLPGLVMIWWKKGKIFIAVFGYSILSPLSHWDWPQYSQHWSCWTLDIWIHAIMIIGIGSVSEAFHAHNNWSLS